MKKIHIKKIDLPKMWNGGTLEDENGFSSLLRNQVLPGDQPSFPDPEVTFDGDTGPAQGSAEAVKGIRTGISMIPGWGQVAAGAMAVGDALGKGTKDEFGIYKNKGSQVLDNIVSPTTQISNIIDTFKDPSLENIGNTLSLGVIGKGSRQRELEKLKKRYEYDVTARGATMNQKAGDVARNSLPVYQAPRYGEQGMKLTTKRYTSKFSKPK